MYGSVFDTRAGNPPAAPRIPPAAPAPRPRFEVPRWEVLTTLRRYSHADVDDYRVQYGKDEGEARFFADHTPDETRVIPGNMLLANGASALWQFALGLGTATANIALGSGPTYFNAANTNFYVGDGGIATGSGTVSITIGTGSLTFSTSQTGLQGKYVEIVGDTSNGIYLIISGSGTSWTISGTYGSSGNASGAAWSYLAAESHSQTGLSGSSNTAHQAMDGGFPANVTSAQLNVITAATNATPIVLTISGGDISTNDIVQVYEVNGNTGANGMFVANPASASSVTLLGSVGNSAWTFGGIVTKLSVMKFQATFGPSLGNFQWCEWSVVNGTGGNKISLNRKVFSGGTKSGGSLSLQVAIGIG